MRYAARYGALFANRAVALFVTALMFSRIGDQFVAIGVLWAALELTHNPAATGLIVMAMSASVLFGGVFAGSLLVRYPRKPLIIADNVVRVLCIGGLAAAGLLHAWSVPLLIVLAAIAANAGAVTVVAARVYLPTMVTGDLVVTAFAVDSSLYQVASIAGPAAAGIVTANYGASWALAAGAGCFALFVLIAAFIPRGGLDAGRPPLASAVSVDEELSGARFIVQNPVLRSTTVLTIVANFFFTIAVFGLAFLSKDVFGTAARGQGIMLAALAVGALIASIALGAMHRRFPRGVSFITSSLVCGIFCALLGVAPSLAAACLVLVLLGAADAAWFIWMSELRQRTPPPELVARVVSASMILNVVSMPFSNAATGFAVSALGVRPMYLVTGLALAAVSALYLFNRPLREAP